MNTDISTHLIKKTDAAYPWFKPQVLQPDIIVHSGISEIDMLLGGFKAGEITFITGDSELIEVIPSQICVNTYKAFHTNTVYVDGGMCANPYEITRYARMIELDQREALSHVHISRAFTVYQLSTLLQNQLEPMIQRLNPQTIIIGILPGLYLDPDVPYQEARALLTQDLRKIRELTLKYGLITVFTNLDTTRLSRYKTLRQILYADVDEIVAMKQRGRCIHLNLVKRNKGATLVCFARGQLQLDDFGMVLEKQDRRSSLVSKP